MVVSSGIIRMATMAGNMVIRRIRDNPLPSYLPAAQRTPCAAQHPIQWRVSVSGMALRWFLPSAPIATQAWLRARRFVRTGAKRRSLDSDGHRMFHHPLYGHLELLLLLITLGSAITIVTLYFFMIWREGKRRQVPKFTAKLQHRLQTARRGSKKTSSGKGKPITTDKPSSISGRRWRP